MREMASPEQLEQAVRGRFPDVCHESPEIFGIPTLWVEPDGIVDICAFLKEDPALRFDYLMSLTAVDWSDRFDVVYHLYSIPLKHYITLKLKVDRQSPAVPSVVSVWKAADWQEREVYDMFGISFEGHPDLRRVLLEPEWEGYPLRKDYGESAEPERKSTS